MPLLPFRPPRLRETDPTDENEFNDAIGILNVFEVFAPTVIDVKGSTVCYRIKKKKWIINWNARERSSLSPLCRINPTLRVMMAFGFTYVRLRLI